MKNYSRGKGTLIGEIPEGTEFEKIADYVGSYKKDQLKVLGYLKTHSDLYNKPSYSLFCDHKGKKILLNVPAWYGSQLEEDFLESKEYPEEFFGGASIKEISTWETKFKNNSYNIEIYE